MCKHDNSMVSEQDGESYKLKMALKLLSRLEVGVLHVILPNGTRHEITGRTPGPSAELEIIDYEVISRVVKDGDMGFAESYMDGLWETPDLSCLLRLLRINISYLAPERYRRIVELMNRVLHALRRNNRRGSQRNITYHYDLGNDFYSSWLDETMTYSCAVFADPEQLLAEAQRNKFRLIFEQLNCKSGDHILEIGSGWGGFAIYAAKNYGCQVTGITLSQQQLEWARQAADEAGVTDRVSFYLRDYREINETYDGVVSIEMYEAVGERYWPAYFNSVRQALKPGKMAVIQAITINHAVFERYRRQVDFVQKYIFPGGMLASVEILSKQIEMQNLQMCNLQSYGDHYANTLHQWHDSVMRVQDRVRKKFGERFLRMWRYYLTGCEAEIAHGDVDLVQFSLKCT